MNMPVNHLRQLLAVLLLVLVTSLVGCSSDSGTNSSGPLPQPSVDCGGSSCID